MITFSLAPASHKVCLNVSEHSWHILTSGPQDNRMLSLPGTTFQQISVKLALSPPPNLCSPVMFTVKPTLTTLLKNWVSTPWIPHLPPICDFSPMHLQLSNIHAIFPHLGCLIVLHCQKVSSMRARLCVCPAHCPVPRAYNSTCHVVGTQ